ncbi:MAG: ATP-dependent sacrificial sulfur transferase LarE [Candidatus Omnitrophota bacterium]
MDPQEKLDRLKKTLKDMHSCLVAFSGGTDSSFLLYVASGILPRNRLLAVTANSPTYTPRELDSAKEFTRAISVRHRVINTRELKDKRFTANPANRCYFCKLELFGRLKEIAGESGLEFVIDASNASDKKDYRPGNKAKKELGVRSPLAEASLTKKEIRFLSRKLRLSTWDKPEQACLASRIPYGARISERILRKVSCAESVLRRMGFKQVRLRHYDGLCRIEVPKKEIGRLINKHIQVIDKLKKLGYNYITVDLEGYRSGSMNIAVAQTKR